MSYSMLRLSNIFQQYTLVIIFFLLPWFVIPGATDSINTTNLILLTTGAGILFCSRLLVLAFQEKHVIVHSVFDWLFLLLGAAAMLATFTSIDQPRSLWGIHDEGTLSLALIFSLIVCSWFVIQQTSTAKVWWMYIYALMAGTAFLAFVSHIQNLSFLSVSTTQLGVGMFFSIFSVLFVGLALSSSRTKWQIFFLYIVAIFSMVSIFSTSLLLPRIFLAIGFGVISALGIFFTSAAPRWRTLLTISLFVISLITIFFPSWKLMHQTAQPDMLLGSNPSWQVVAESYRDNPKQALLGNGPGTFLYMFNSYRSEAFNNDPITAAIRFAWPHNSIVALLSEFGLLFTTIFFLFLFIFFGILSTSWKKQQTLIASLRAVAIQSHKSLTALDVFVCSVVLLLATVGFFVCYLEFAYWGMWWLLFSLTVVVSSGFIPSLFTKKEYRLRVPEQYRLASIFGLLLVVSVVIVLEVFMYRAYFADRAYMSSFGLPAEIAESTLEKARTLHAGNERYAIALAYHRVGQAQLYSNDSENLDDEDAEYVVVALQNSVNMLRAQTTLQPHNVLLWQTLAELYGVTRTFTPDAVTWQISSLEQAIENDPINALLYVKLGVAYETADNYREAERTYKHALTLQPSLHRARVRLALLHEENEDYDKAIALFLPILSTLQNEPDLLTFIGRLYYNRGNEGDLEAAEQLWLAALRRSPQLVDAHYALQVLYERTGNKEEALKHKTALEQLQ